MHCAPGRTPPHFVVNVMQIIVLSLLTYTLVRTKLCVDMGYVTRVEEVEFSALVLCVNSGSLPCAPRCGDPLYHMLESPTFPSTVLSTL